MSSYAGITIGPIVDTLMLAHSPAAMWYASSMFSSLTEEICKNIKEDMPDGNIISPYYTNERFNDGIGRYHDRIIIENADCGKIEKIVDKSKDAIAKMVALDIDASEDETKNIVAFVKNYIQVHYVYLPQAEDTGNTIKDMGDMLNTLEQMSSPNPDNTNNPFIKLFEGREGSRNEYVKKRVKLIAENSQLRNKDGTLKSIPDIAGEKKILKKDYYYAVVEADGDKVGSYIETLAPEEIKEFSKKCFEYASEAAKLIGAYGGMTVYAGGDDLLFMAPVYGNGEKSVFDLCRDISKKFKEIVTGNNAEFPAVSFGIAVRRQGFPLYEALHSSLAALYEVKSKKIGGNGIFIDFQKGSGQAIKLAVPFEKYELFETVFKVYTEATDKALKSLIYILDLHKKMFQIEDINEAMIENIIKNAFDNIQQKKYEDFVNKASERITRFIRENGGKRIIGYGKGKDLTDMIIFEAILRLSKFMIEGKGEESRA